LTARDSRIAPPASVHSRITPPASAYLPAAWLREGRRPRIRDIDLVRRTRHAAPATPLIDVAALVRGTRRLGAYALGVIVAASIVAMPTAFLVVFCAIGLMLQT
jgi:hypothetical protein